MLDEYAEALRRGWSPDTVRAEAAGEELRSIAEDPDRFVASLVDREAVGPPIPQPDGSFARRLPGFRLWMWADGFCGSIGFRWQPGTGELPDHVPGHIGYSVVPWRRREGHATTALGLVLPSAAAEGLPFVDLVTTEDNVASQRVIEANGGIVVELSSGDRNVCGPTARRYRISLVGP